MKPWIWLPSAALIVFRCVVPPSSFQDRYHASTTGIRTRRRLGEPPGSDKLSAGKFWYVFFLLGIVAGQKNMVRAQ